MHRMIRIVCIGAVLAPMTGRALRAQSEGGDLADRGPRFMVAAAPSATPVPIEVGRAPVLLERISVDLRGATLGQALAAISRESGLKLMYSTTVVPLDRPVRLKADDITVAAALTEVLLDTGVDVLFSKGGQAVLVRRSGPVPVRVQPGSVVGRVTDAKTGEGLAGAEVFLEKTRAHATTAEDGRYRLAEVEPGSYTLTARRIGYAKQSRAVTVVSGQESTVDVALDPVPTNLDEVVVTATGEQRLRELGHVVGRINADSLVKEAPIASVTELLTARIPGLHVQQLQGTVGGEVKLQIRSPSSIALSTEPIVIVDGIRYRTDPRSGPTKGYPIGLFGNEGTSRLNDLNPNDIESIEVAKGPSAATLYGTDAANGVIVITTKRGRSGPPRWNAFGRSSFSEIPAYRYPDTYWGWGSATSNCTLRSVAQGGCVQDSVTVLPNPLNDPALTIFSREPRWEYGANVAGGSEALRYYFSADLEDATGPFGVPPALVEQIKARRGVSELPEELRKPNTLSKLNLHSTVSAGVGQAAELRVSAGYTQGATRTLVGSGPFGGAIRRDPTNPFDPQSSPEDAFSQASTERVNRFFGSAMGEWRPRSWLQTRATVGLDLTSSYRYSLIRRGDAPNSVYAGGGVGDDRTRYLVTSADLGATASFHRGRVSSRTSVGAQYVRSLFDALTTAGEGLPPGGSTIGEAASVRTDQDYNEQVTLGTYLEQTVGLNDRLFLSGALRMDGASGFGQDYNVAVYPKAGVSWLVSEEPFMPRVPGLDELRLRYAFGGSGQQAWSVWQRRNFDIYQDFVDGQAGSVVTVGGIGNPDLRPERTREHEFGLDATALGGRARLDLTWNSRTTFDQLTMRELSPGFGELWTNLGRVDGHGFEAGLTVRPLDSRAVTWDVTLNHAWHTSAVVDLGGGLANEVTLGGWAEGYPIGGRFSLPLLGYADANGNGIIEDDEVQLGESPIYVGRSVPPRTQTLGTTVGLFRHRLRISALLDRQSGFVQPDPRAVQCYAGYCREGVDPTTPLDEQALVAAVRAAGSFYRFSAMRSGDFTRLREVTLVLDLPDGLVRAARLREASLSISARNLALWTSADDEDPESGGAIPQARAWAFRLDIGL